MEWVKWVGQTMDKFDIWIYLFLLTLLDFSGVGCNGKIKIERAEIIKLDILIFFMYYI